MCMCMCVCMYNIMYVCVCMYVCLRWREVGLRGLGLLIQEGVAYTGTGGEVPHRVQLFYVAIFNHSATSCMT